MNNDSAFHFMHDATLQLYQFFIHLLWMSLSAQFHFEHA